MNLGYNKITEISTNDLPFIDSNVLLVFGFISSPSYQTITDLQQWGRDLQIQGDPNVGETSRIAAKVLSYVKTPDGEMYGLDTIEAIEIFIDETSFDFVTNLLLGWLALKAVDRVAKEKKILPFSTLSNGTNPQATQTL